jgi:hypothetical protein
MKTTKTAPTFLRTSYTEKLTFPGKPDAATRKALREAGFRWNGTQWWRNTNNTGTIKPRELSTLLAPVNDNAEPDINDVLEAALTTA